MKDEKEEKLKLYICRAFGDFIGGERESEISGLKWD